MAETLTSRIQLTVSAFAALAADLVTPVAQLAKQITIDLATGVGLNQADQVWSDTRTVLTGATDSIDFKGSLVDHLGQPFTPVKIKAIYIRAAAANTTVLSVGGNAAAVLIFKDKTDIEDLDAGAMLLIVKPSLAAIPVTAATGDILDIVNAAGASAVYDIIVVGTSA